MSEEQKNDSSNNKENTNSFKFIIKKIQNEIKDKVINNFLDKIINQGRELEKISSENKILKNNLTYVLKKIMLYKNFFRQNYHPEPFSKQLNLSSANLNNSSCATKRSLIENCSGKNLGHKLNASNSRSKSIITRPALYNDRHYLQTSNSSLFMENKISDYINNLCAKNQFKKNNLNSQNYQTLYGELFTSEKPNNLDDAPSRMNMKLNSKLNDSYRNNSQKSLTTKLYQHSSCQLYNIPPAKKNRIICNYGILNSSREIDSFNNICTSPQSINNIAPIYSNNFSKRNNSKKITYGKKHISSINGNNNNNGNNLNTMNNLNTNSNTGNINTNANTNTNANINKKPKKYKLCKKPDKKK